MFAERRKNSFCASENYRSSSIFILKFSCHRLLGVLFPVSTSCNPLHGENGGIRLRSFAEQARKTTLFEHPLRKGCRIVRHRAVFIPFLHSVKNLFLAETFASNSQLHFPLLVLSCAESCKRSLCNTVKMAASVFGRSLSRHGRLTLFEHPLRKDAACAATI